MERLYFTRDTRYLDGRRMSRRIERQRALMEKKEGGAYVLYFADREGSGPAVINSTRYRVIKAYKHFAQLQHPAGYMVDFTYYDLLELQKAIAETDGKLQRVGGDEDGEI